MLTGRSWRWLRVRILGLLETPPVGWRTVRVDDRHTRDEPVWATRIQAALFTPRKG